MPVFVLNLLYSSHWYGQVSYLKHDHELQSFPVCGSDSSLAWRRPAVVGREEILLGPLWRQEASSVSEEEESGREL